MIHFAATRCVVFKLHGTVTIQESDVWLIGWNLKIEMLVWLQEQMMICSSRKEKIEEERMECSLWSALPTELLERVLAFLPFPFLFRLRSVCKRWNALPHCGYFRQLVGDRPWGACLPVLFCKDASADEDEGWYAHIRSSFLICTARVHCASVVKTDVASIMVH